MARKKTPKATRDAVLKEYNHRCAVCGSDRPHLHHIDENPANDDPFNLIPLCPNHHLNDQHNPTTKIEIPILRLFRKYKDPAVLLPQFRPVYERMRYLYEYKNLSGSDIEKAQQELAKFVEYLDMGPYYASRLVQVNPLHYRNDHIQDVLLANQDRTSKLQSRVVQNWEEVERLIIEMLRYQSWQGNESRTRGQLGASS
jgi:hypothetical protein